MGKLDGRFNDGQDSTIPPLDVTGLTVTDVGTNRPFAASASTNQASASGVGAAATISWNPNSSSTYLISTTPATYTAIVNTTNTYVFEGLASATSYTFTVQTSNSFGTSSGVTSSLILVTSVPDTPKNVSATAQVNQDIISWDAPTNNGGYGITSYTVNAYGSNPSYVANIISSPYTYSEAANNTDYYNVVAFNKNGPSAQSANSQTVTTLFSPPSFFSPPFFPPSFVFAPPFFPPFFPPNFFFPPTFFHPPSFNFRN